MKSHPKLPEREALVRGIQRRRQQKLELESFIQLHPEDYCIQANFFVPNTSEHICIRLSGTFARHAERAIWMSFLKQLKDLDERLAALDSNQNL